MYFIEAKLAAVEARLEVAVDDMNSLKAAISKMVVAGSAQAVCLLLFASFIVWLFVCLI